MTDQFRKPASVDVAGERKGGAASTPAPPTSLSSSEAYLLRWLADAEFSQYGECHGAALDALMTRGLAVIHGAGEHQGGFIAQGGGAMHRAVSITDAGRAALNDLPAIAP